MFFNARRKLDRGVPQLNVARGGLAYVNEGQPQDCWCPRLDIETASLSRHARKRGRKKITARCRL